MGTVFRLGITNGGGLALLATFSTFSYDDGTFPEGTLVQGPNNSFYGTTFSGGLYDLGTIFMVTTNGILATLVSFDGTNGSYPQSGVIIGSDGNYYGTTSAGGADGCGTVFEITANGQLTNVASFASAIGKNPQGPLVEGPFGDFYGTARSGGNSGYGTVFKFSPASTTSLMTVVNFNRINGAYPNAGLARDADGNLYGTTSEGGSGGAGTVFRVFSELTFSLYGHELILSWLTNSTVTNLQSATSLNGPWTDMTGQSVFGERYLRPIETATGSMLFRLVGTNN